MQIWQESLIRRHQPSRISVFSRLMSELYDQSWYATFSPEEVKFFASHAQNKRTLEIASGTGRVTIPMLEYGLNLYGIEGSVDMFTILQSKLSSEQRDRFLLWDARRTPYPAKEHSFGCVIVPFSSFGMIHDGVADLGSNKILYEINRLLTADGFLIINDYRTEGFKREKLEEPEEVLIHQHHHPDHGCILEEQYSCFEIVPNRILPEQVLRKRRTVLVREKDKKVLEEHREVIPLWDVHDFPVLGADAGFSYLRGEICHFHEDPSIHHIFQKVSELSRQNTFG